MTMLIRVF